MPVVSKQALGAILGAPETRGRVTREDAWEARGQRGFQEAANGPARVKGPGWAPALQSCDGEFWMFEPACRHVTGDVGFCTCSRECEEGAGQLLGEGGPVSHGGASPSKEPQRERLCLSSTPVWVGSRESGDAGLLEGCGWEGWGGPQPREDGPGNRQGANLLYG